MSKELLSSAAARGKRHGQEDVEMVLLDLAAMGLCVPAGPERQAYNCAIAVLEAALREQPKPRPKKTKPKPRKKRVRRKDIDVKPKGSLSNWLR